VAETLRQAIVAFCDNSEAWFSGKDILLFVKQLRDIEKSHPAENDVAAAGTGLVTAMQTVVVSLESAAVSLRAAEDRIREATSQARSSIDSL
jgi:hypothetical protein